jgi:tripartite-type tricarboxylate transporter receptor subunit TctC
MWFTKALARAFLAAPLIALPAAGANAAYPDKPVRIVVPFLAGGSIDVLARMTAQHLSAKLGQNFFVDNRAGAGGTIGADFVAKAAPDGYTLMFTAQGPLVINPFIMKQLPYEAKSAFAPVSVVVEAPNVLTARPGVPYRTFKDFLAFGKSHPDQMNFGSQGVGTTGHITAAMITQQTGLELTHVPYKGFPPMLTDVMTGRVPSPPRAASLPCQMFPPLRRAAIQRSSQDHGSPCLLRRGLPWSLDSA